MHFVWEVSQKGLVPGLVQLGSDLVPFSAFFRNLTFRIGGVVQSAWFQAWFSLVPIGFHGGARRQYSAFGARGVAQSAWFQAWFRLVSKWVPWRDGSNFSLHFCTISQHARSFSSHNTHLGRLASPDEKQTAIWQTYGTAHACLIQSGMNWFRTFEKKTKCMSVNSPWAGQTSS